jgi:THO complex subunit 1
VIIISADCKAQTEWALGIKNSIANYLQDGPDGKFYYRMVDTVLSRDKNWVRWKMENCQPFTRDRVPTKDFLEANTGGVAELRNKEVKLPGRSFQLTFLSKNETEKGLSKLKQSKRCVPLVRLWRLMTADSQHVRSTPPSIDIYAKKIRMCELDMEMVASEEEKRQLEEGKTSNTWRGLRLASKHRLSSLDRLEQGKGLERLFQPVTSIEAAGEDNASAGPEGRDPVPQEQHQSVEELRPDQQSQVTPNDAAE